MAHLKSMDLDMTSPKMTIKDLNMNNLTILVGANGTGKTFCMVNFWATTTVLNIIALGELYKSQGTEKLEAAQMVYNKSFSDQKFTGSIKTTFTDGSYIRITLDEGDVTSVDTSPNPTNVTPVVYMSGGMRTFSNISMYLKIRKVETTGKTLTPAEIMQAMMLHFKMYDVMYLENLIHRMPFEFPVDLQKTLKDHYDFNETILSMHVDLQKCDFYITTTEGTKFLTTYGAGHQSLLNMFVGSYLNKDNG